MSLRYFGYLLITVGFLGGSLEVVRQVEGVNTASFLVWLSIGIVGVIVAQRARKAEATDVEVITTNVRAIESSLEVLTAEAKKLNAEKSEINVYDLRHRIDAAFMADLVKFVDARESIAHSYGLKAYAEVMNRFAAGERALNRVWSASTDGYIDETSNYLEKAATNFEDALVTFQTIKATGGLMMQEPRATV
jgi:hypothetical protein